MEKVSQHFYVTSEFILLFVFSFGTVNVLAQRWRFCSKKLINSHYEVQGSQNSNEYVTHVACIRRIEPLVMDYDDAKSTAGLHGEATFEIGILFNENIMYDLNTSPILCALRMVGNNNDESHSQRLITLGITPYHGEIRLEVGRTEVLSFTSVERKELFFELQCRTHDMRELLPHGVRILFANFSKLVAVKKISAVNFNGSRVVEVCFQAALPVLFEGLPVCIVDHANFTVPVISSTNPIYCVQCDFSRHQVNVGDHTLWVVRSSELLNATLYIQNPTRLIVSNNASGQQWLTVASDAVTVKTNACFKRAYFANMLDSVIFEIDPIISITNDGQLLETPCVDIFDDLTRLGGMPQCGLLNGTLLTVKLGDNATVNVGDQLYVRLPSRVVNASCGFDETELVVVEKPTKASAPQVILRASPEDLPCEGTEGVQLVATATAGTGRHAVSCLWNFVGVEQTEFVKLGSVLRNCTLDISASQLSVLRDPSSRNLIVSARVCNFLGVCAHAEPLKLSAPQNATRFSVQILGVPARCLCSIRIVLSARPMFTACSNITVPATSDLLLNGISYTWLINNTKVSRNAVFHIASNAYECGKHVTVRLRAEFQDSNGQRMSAHASCELHFVAENIITVTDGSSRSVPVNEPLRLDASHSWSPNGRTSALTHSWECRNLSTIFSPASISLQRSNSFAIADPHDLIALSNMSMTDSWSIWQPYDGVLTCSNLSELFAPNSRNSLNCVFDESPADAEGPDWKIGVLALPPNSLIPIDGVFVFRDVISDGKMHGETFVRVHVQRPDVPLIRLQPTHNVEHFSSDAFLRVQAFVRSKYGPLAVVWRLFCVHNGTRQLEELRLESISPSKLTRNFTEVEVTIAPELVISLIIPPPHRPDGDKNEWRKLESNGSYVLRLSATNPVGDAYTDFPFRVYPPPKIHHVQVDPMDGILALVTTVRFSVTPTADFSGQFRFGLRKHMADGRSQDFWTRSSAVNFYEMILPSAWPEPYASCGIRVGFQALAEVCDIWGACARAESEHFVVGHSVDIKSATDAVVASIEARLVDGDSFKALELLEALRQERCNDTVDVQMVDRVLSKLLAEGILSSTQDSDELLEGLQLAMHIANYASPRRVDEILSLVNRVRDSLHMNSTALKPLMNDTEVVDTTTITMTSPKLRTKRNVNLMSMMRNEASSSSVTINEAAASTLLGAYDLLMGRKQDVVRVYLNNIEDIIAGFCVQSNTLNVMQASGRTYTQLQSQDVMPGEAEFNSTSYSIAGVEDKILTFNQNFSAFFSNWQCANGSASCSEICVGTAQTQLAALTDNPYLQRHFFASQYANIKLENAVSNLYHFYFLDPIDGSSQNLRGGAAIHVDIPIIKYLPSDYYKCFMFTGAVWEDHVCESDTYARGRTSTTAQFYLTCHCSKLGILAVFTVNPPTPPQYSPYNEIQLTFYLSTSKTCTLNELHAFIEHLAEASGIDSARFVQMSCELVNGTSMDNSGHSAESALGTVSTILRPPFRKAHLTNSYAIQAIKKTINMDSGFVAYGDIKVLNVTESVVPRALNGDRNARRVILHIDRSYKDVVGSDPIFYATRWVAQMAEDMRISVYRFKNPILMMGITFNITITMPFVGEALPNTVVLSAEEIAEWIKEQVHYAELELRDSHNQLLPIEILTDQDIIELRIAQNITVLAIAFAVVISTAFAVIVAITCGLVFVKIRTDRLIETHNANMQTVDITDTVPISVNGFNNAIDYKPTNTIQKDDRKKTQEIRKTKKLSPFQGHEEIIPSKRVENKTLDTTIFRGRHTLECPSD